MSEKRSNSQDEFCFAFKTVSLYAYLTKVKKEFIDITDDENSLLKMIRSASLTTKSTYNS